MYTYTYKIIIGSVEEVEHIVNMHLKNGGVCVGGIAVMDRGNANTHPIVMQAIYVLDDANVNATMVASAGIDITDLLEIALNGISLN